MKGFFNHRFLALVQKEFNQLRRDPKVVTLLIVLPVLQLLLFGFILNSKIENVRLGVIDQSRTPESRELIADLSESRSFRLTRSYLTPVDLTNAITDGTVQAGVVIPYDFARDLQTGKQADVQFLLNAMDANTATIARTYARGVIAAYSANLSGAGLHAQFNQIAARDVGRTGGIELQPSFLYNPGLEGAWFTVTGVLGLLAILNGSLVASNTMVREREFGTIEQLLMSPASTSEVIIAKIAPLFVLLSLMTLNAIAIVRLACDQHVRDGAQGLFARVLGNRKAEGRIDDRIFLQRVEGVECQRIAEEPAHAAFNARRGTCPARLQRRIAGVRCAGGTTPRAGPPRAT